MGILVRKKILAWPFFGVSVSVSFKSPIENSFLFGVIVPPPPEFSV